MKISGIGFVYMITCIITGKIYVGSSIDVDQRWSDYKQRKSSKQRKLQNSFNKYGINNHIFEIVWAGELCDMYKYETLIGWGFNVLEREVGLNCQLPKLGDVWQCYSEERLKRMSDIMTGRILSDEWKDKIRQKHIGMKASPETLIKMSIARKGLSTGKRSDEVRLKISLGKIGVKNPNFGKKHIKEWYDKVNIPVIQYSKLDVFIKEWNSISEAARELKINASHITSCCKQRGSYKTIGGFKWKYKNKE